jgi:hypothetical protein
MASPEETLRAALTWAKENGYTIDRRAVYNKYCDGVRALILHSSKEDVPSNTGKTIEIARAILDVTPEWVRAFGYGFGGNLPHLLGGSGPWSGPALETPAEAFKLGQDLSLEFCGPLPWKFNAR